MEQQKQLQDLLFPLGYRLFKQDLDDYKIVNDLWQREVKDAKAVCEENHKLYLDIQGVIFSGETMLRINTSITAERCGLWWDINCYSLSLDELRENLTMIENNLIQMFYLITNAPQETAPTPAAKP